MSRYTRVIVCLLLAWLPLQAVALPVLALKCHAGAARPAAMHAAMVSGEAGTSGLRGSMASALFMVWTIETVRQLRSRT